MTNKPCSSHIKALNKVSSKLRWGLTMDSSTLILSDENHERLEEAEKLIEQAAIVLNEIE